MAKLLTVTKTLERERKQLQKQNREWSHLHKDGRALINKNTTMIKDLLRKKS
jgi:hypothetical protein